MPVQTQSTNAQHPRTLAEAQAFIARIYQTVTGSEQVDICRAAGRVIASDIRAPTALPRFAASAMDGVALRDSDIREQTSRVLRVIGTAKAGHPFSGEIGAGEAVRINTGAPMPAGADRVVLQEDCHFKDERVVLIGQPSTKRHIRYPGEDVSAGALILCAGSRLTAANVAVLAAFGMHGIVVKQKLKVSLLSTGDELVCPGQRVEHGQIYDCNGPFLKSALEKTGCEVVELGIVPDDRDALLARLIAAAADSDLIITSGGASVGAEDHVASLVRRRGYLEFWRLNMKPGKPVGLGDVDDCPLLMLPGNPVAAAAAFKFLGEPLINRLSGNVRFEPPKLRLPLAVGIAKASDKLELLMGNLVALEEGRSALEVQSAQGSANVAALSASDGWIMLSEDIREVPQGSIVPFYPS